MKKTTTWSGVRQVTRREFVGSAIAAGAVFAHAPAVLRGQNLNSKLNIAVIGAGGRGRASINELTLDPANPPKRTDGSGSLDKHPDENIVALCDINQESLDSAGVRFPKAQKFTDLRKVFDKPGAFDSVVVATAEHTHVFATYLALIHGKHVYCEKPLAYNIWETRLIRETAAKYPRLSTQMGNQGHASPARRIDQGDPEHRRHRQGERSARLGQSRVGPAGCRVGREVRQAARLLQRHPDRRSVPRSDAGAARASTSTCGSARRRCGRSTRRTSRVRAGIAGGTSATAR